MGGIVWLHAAWVTAASAPCVEHRRSVYRKYGVLLCRIVLSLTSVYHSPPFVSVLHGLLNRMSPELLLLTWGLFFIATSRAEETDPELHARDFSAPLKKLYRGCRSNHRTYQDPADGNQGTANDDAVVEYEPK